MITLFLSMFVGFIVIAVIIGVFCALGLCTMAVLLPFIDLIVFGFIVIVIYKLITLFRK